MGLDKIGTENIDSYLSNLKISILGLGYVGLPLAFQFDKKNGINPATGQKFFSKIIGFDIDAKRIEELNRSFDRTNEFKKEEFENIRGLFFTCDSNFLERSDIFIVSVPTPIDDSKNPDLRFLEYASRLVGESINYLSKTKIDSNFRKPIVIFESTVFPGATEEVCVPLIEKYSNLVFNKDFYCGYSPERINPGDPERKIKDIVKVTSGSSKEAAKIVDKIYSTIIEAGTYLATSIKVAEAAKVIENTQRDINIALVNELAVICNKLGIDTNDVLQAAKTKWNFIDFRPGLVGGHCIGVDPYYLTYKSKRLGYTPEVVLAGRKINDGMADYIVDRFILNLLKNKINITDSNILILGVSFKENCPDFRNSLVINIIKKLKQFNLRLSIVDPQVDHQDIYIKYGFKVGKKISDNKKYAGIIAAVAHDEFQNFSFEDWKKIMKESCIIFDIKGFLPRNLNALRL